MDEVDERSGFQKMIGVLTGKEKAEVDIEVNTKINEESLMYIIIGILFTGIVLILFSIMLRKLFKV